MTPTLLRRAAAVYGSQQKLALALGGAPRTMRRCTAGDSAIPDTLPIDLFNLCINREAEFRGLRDNLIDEKGALFGRKWDQPIGGAGSAKSAV